MGAWLIDHVVVLEDAEVEVHIGMDDGWRVCGAWYVPHVVPDVSALLAQHSLPRHPPDRT